MQGSSTTLPCEKLTVELTIQGDTGAASLPTIPVSKDRHEDAGKKDPRRASQSAVVPHSRTSGTLTTEALSPEAHRFALVSLSGPWNFCCLQPQVTNHVSLSDQQKLVSASFFSSHLSRIV